MYGLINFDIIYILKQYFLDQTFNSYEEALNVIKNELIWSGENGKISKVKAGQKHEFRCNKVKFREEQCAASVYILLHNNDSKVIAIRISAQSSDSCNARTIIPLAACDTSLATTKRSSGRPSLAYKRLQFQPHKFSSIITQIVEQDDIEARFEQEIVVQEFADNSNVSNIDEVSQFNVDTVQSIEDLLIGTNSESSNDEIPTTSQILSISQPTLPRKSLIKIGNKASNNTTVSLTQLPKEIEVRYNKDGSISKKRRPKPKSKQ